MWLHSYERVSQPADTKVRTLSYSQMITDPTNISDANYLATIRTSIVLQNAERHFEMWEFCQDVAFVDSFSRTHQREPTSPTFVLKILRVWYVSVRFGTHLISPFLCSGALSEAGNKDSVLSASLRFCGVYPHVLEVFMSAGPLWSHAVIHCCPWERLHDGGGLLQKQRCDQPLGR